MNKAKKIISSLLSVALIFGLVSNSKFNLDKVDAAKTGEITSQVVLSNCDSLDSWGGTNVTLDNTIKVEGTGSIKGKAINSPDYDNITIRQMFTSKFDIRSMDYLELSLYIENVDQLTGGMGIEISSSGNGTNQVIRWSKEYFVKQITQVGWNHLRLPLVEAVAATTDNKDYNGEEVNWFRFYCLPPKNTNRSTYIDNLKATKYEEVPIILGETGVNGNGTIDKTLFTEGYSSIGAKGTTAISFQIKTPRTIDISGKKIIELDFYTTNPNMFATSNGLELSSSGKADENELQWPASYFSNQIKKVGWNHLTLEIEKATKSGTPNLSALNFFRFYSNNAAISDEITVRIDNMKAVKSKIVNNGTLFSECENLAGWGGSGAPVIDKTEFLTGAGSISVTSTGNTSSIQWKLPTAIDVSGHSFFEFDLYTSDLDIFGSDASVELSSGGIHEASEINWSKDMLMAQITKVGWNHIKLSFDRAGTSSGNTGPYVPENTNWFRFYSVHNQNKEITLKIDNMRVTNNDKGVVEIDMVNHNGNLIVDASGNGNNAVIKGNVSFVENNDSTTAKFEAGKTGYLEISNPDQILNGDLTILAKFKPAKLDGTEQLIVGKNLYILNNRAWSLYIDKDKSLKFLLRNASNEWVTAVISNDLKIDEWYSAAVVISGDVINIYLNNRYVTSVTNKKGKAVGYAPIYIGATNDRKSDGSDYIWQQFTGEIADVEIYDYALSIQTEKYNLWDANVPLPTKQDFIPVEDIEFSNVALLENYKYQHESAIARHNGKLYYTFARNTQRENIVGQIVVCYVSDDDGKTWTYHSQVGEKIDTQAWVGGALLSVNGELWAFQPKHDGVAGGEYPGIATSMFVLNETTGKWTQKNDIKIENFWPNQAPKKMANGNWIMSGLNRKFNGAVAISDGNDLTKWTAVNIPVGAKTYSESTLMVDGENLVIMMRDEKPEGMSSNTIAVSTSSDYGKTWTEAIKSDMPANTSKPSSGTLSTGQRFFISNSYNGVYNTRENLTIAIGAPGSDVLSKVFLIRDVKVPESLTSLYGNSDQKIICYPYSIELDGYLYVAYSSYAVYEGNDGWNQNHMEFAKFPVSQFLMPFLSEEDSEKVADVNHKIKSIPTVDDLKLSHKTEVEAARFAFNSLSENLQDLISADLIQKLILSESKISALEHQLTTNKQIADEVTGKINLLPETSAVKISDKSAVQLARAAYDLLNDAQKAMVDSAKLNKLSALEAKIAELENQVALDKQKADDATAKINALPEVSSIKLSGKTDVESARATYTALTEAQKALVDSTTLNKLKALEDKIAELENVKPEPSDTRTSSSGESTTTQISSNGSQTGDNSKIALFISLLLASIMALFVFVRRRKHF